MRARYFPIEKGVYEVAPGLRPFGTDFGNRELDKKLFQIDDEFLRYRNNKIECRRENLGKYYLTEKLSPELHKRASKFISEALCKEYPDFFILESPSENEIVLVCSQTEEKLFFSKDWSFVKSQSYCQVPVYPNYKDGIDALASQVQEDIAFQEIDSAGNNWLSALHVCSPAHWSPGDKIGKTFAGVHKPVPGIEKINAAQAAFAEAMVKKGPFVRFVWGFSTDTRLNHHPEAPPNFDKSVWSGRKFSSPLDSKFYLRVERQVTWGFPDLNASLFTIRVSYIPGDEIKSNPEEREKLISALSTMKPESLRYKGLAGSVEPLISWLKG